MSTDRHIVTFKKNAQAEKRLICVPYAGGTAAYYRPWLAHLPLATELQVVELPGRIHMKEEAASDMDSLVDTIYSEVAALTDVPYVFFGHSLGSAVAYELTRRLQSDGRRLPDALFVSSRRAPHLPLAEAPISSLDSAAFIEIVQALYENGIPQQIVEEKEILELFLPILRADIKVNETYQREVDSMLDTPVTLFYGTTDASLSLEDLEAWKAVTSGPFEMLPFEGGHFFLTQHRERLISEILKRR
jgi:medium-chain acyl-[acyl-carrier-protein] hydrolase